MESAMKQIEFEITTRKIKKEEVGGEKTYYPIILIKGHDIKDVTFDRIKSAMVGVLPENHVAGEPAIRVGLHIKDGKTEFLGVVISEEGDYRGKKEQLKDFRHRAADIHVSVDDRLATHYRITYGVPTDDIKKELIGILNDKFGKRIEE